MSRPFAVAYARRLVVGGWQGRTDKLGRRARARAQVLGLYYNVTSLFGHSFAEPLPGMTLRARVGEVHATRRHMAKQTHTTQKAAQPAKPAKAPKTYPAAVLAAVTANGMLSRANVAKQCAALGFDKAANVKSALAKVLKEGKLRLDGASYVLDAEERAAAGEAYAAKLQSAMVARDDQHAEKKASRERAENKYTSNLQQAGGLTVTAKADRAWLEGGGGSGARPTPRGFL